LLQNILFALAGLILGSIIGIFVRKATAEKKIISAESEARRIVEEGIKTAETKKKEFLIEAKDEIHRTRNEADRENKERRIELQKLEKRLLKKEELLDNKNELFEKREEKLNKKYKEVEIKEKEVESIIELQKNELERISGFTSDEAKEMLLKDIRKEAE